MSRDLPIAVFLHELTVTHIVDIRTFKALAVLGLLDSLTIAHAVVVIAFKAGSVSIMYNHFTLYLAINELALKDIAVLLRQLTMSVLQVFLP